MGSNDTELAALARVEAFVRERGISAVVVPAEMPTPTVPLAAQAMGVSEDEILKTLLFITPEHQAVIAIASGTRRIDRLKLEQVACLAPLRLAKPDVVLELTGFPAGGVAPVGLPASVPVFVDGAAMSVETTYAGAGTDQHMLKILVADIVRLNNAIVAEITVDPSAY